MKILVTGKTGQLGSEINLLKDDFKQHEFIFTNSQELNLANSQSMISFFEQNSTIDLIINCAAYTAVDSAEDEVERAFQINQHGVGALADACLKYKMKLIHISTDYVFDGTKNTPYIELDEPNPTGVYGESKLQGENEIKKRDIQAIIIRTSWVYSSFGANFVKTMLRLTQERTNLSVVFDQIGTPTSAKDLANVCLQIASNLSSWKKGCTTYHYSNEGVTSWYDFACEINSYSNHGCKIQPIESSEYPTKAKRPYYSVLNKKSIKNDFEILIPHWKKSLTDVLKKLI
jgi:dTDP-4-dehydrorhamnose reductase